MAVKGLAQLRDDQMKRYGRNQKRQARAELASAQEKIKGLEKSLHNMAFDRDAMNSFCSVVESTLGPDFVAFKGERASPVAMQRHERMLRLPRNGPSWDYTRDFEEVSLMVSYFDKLEVMECTAELDRLRGQRYVRVRVGENHTFHRAMSRHCFQGWPVPRVAEELARAIAHTMVSDPDFKSTFMESNHAR